MASTYSDLKVELIGTGEQSGTWGTTTNTNLSVALGEAITGSADVTFASANATITLTDTNGAQAARNLRLNLTGTSSGTHYLILGSGCNIEKLYLINNTLGNAVIVQNTGGGTGVTVAAGKSTFVYNTGTNVVDAVTHLSSLTLGTDLAVADGGTGSSSLTAENVILGNGTNAVKFVAPGNSGNVLTSNGTSWVSQESSGGVTTFSAGTTGLTPNTASNGAITLGGTLAVANGGTGAANATDARTNLSAAASGANSDITSLSGLTTALTVAQGGTGVNSITANAVVLGNSTGAVQTVAAGTSGNVLTSNGTTWISQAIAAGGNYIAQTYTTAGPFTWTKPANLKAVRVTVAGGGGGSGGIQPNPFQAPASVNCGMGGGGGFSVEYIPAPSIPGPVAVTVGPAGTAGAANGAGGAGGTSSFGSFLSATGGGAGTGGRADGVGGAGSGGNVNGNGGNGASNPIGTSGVGGGSFYSFGQLGAGLSGSGGGRPGTNPTPGTAGGAGVVIVEEFY